MNVIHTLVPVNPEIAKATRAGWGTQIAGVENIFPPHYERILDYIDKYAAGNGECHTYVYALVKDRSACADGILEIIHAQPKAHDPWLKLLDIHIAPRFDIDANGRLDTRLVNEISALLGMALTESLRLTFNDHPSTTLKVYGRNDFFMGFFELVVAEVTDALKPQDLDVCRQGRWLVFTKL